MSEDALSLLAKKIAKGEKINFEWMGGEMRAVYQIEIKYHNREKYRHAFFKGPFYGHTEEEAKDVAIVALTKELGWKPYIYKCQGLKITPVNTALGIDSFMKDKERAMFFGDI